MTTTADAQTVALPEPPRSLRIAKISALIVLSLAIVAAVAFFTFTERGHYLTHHYKEAGVEFQHWVAAHRAIAPIATHVSVTGTPPRIVPMITSIVEIVVSPKT
jgi:hypothetical protein